MQFVWNHPLNSSGRIAALGRVARWQMASRLVSGPIALPFVEGTSLFASRGMTGATGNWYCGLHEVRDMAFVLHVLRRGEHFLDVGANVGSYTVLAAGGPSGRWSRASNPSRGRSLTFNEMSRSTGCLAP